LAFVGFARPIRGSFPSLSESAARYIAFAWSGHADIPPPWERERIARLDKIRRDLFFTGFDKYGFTKKCPETGKIARANARAAGLTDLFQYADDMAKLCPGVMPRYFQLLLECGFTKWFTAILAPHHQGQYMLNDPAMREYVFSRYRYFLSRFPVFVPIVFSLILGLFHYWKSYIRNRIFWTIGYLLIKRPHEGAVHIFEHKAELHRQQRALQKVDALKHEYEGR